MEAAVNSLFETSALLGVKGDNAGALENARLCVKEEKKLTKLRDEHGLRDAQNPELTFAVTFAASRQLPVQLVNFVSGSKPFMGVPD